MKKIFFCIIIFYGILSVYSGSLKSDLEKEGLNGQVKQKTERSYKIKNNIKDLIGETVYKYDLKKNMTEMRAEYHNKKDKQNISKDISITEWEYLYY